MNKSRRLEKSGGDSESQNAYVIRSSSRSGASEISQNSTQLSSNPASSIETVQTWFAKHVVLDGKPYTLDYDQARAVFDCHKNTLVVARAGSGKTRVIVAKVAYLVKCLGYSLDEIAIFMFNRAAAAEVNQRIAAVEIDGEPLCQETPTTASTFHKFALDLTKLQGEQPIIISETEHDELIRSILLKILRKSNRKTSAKKFQELLAVVSSFIARAGQKYTGTAGLRELKSIVLQFQLRHQLDPDYQKAINYHLLAFSVYARYLAALKSPKTDFNLLMDSATQLMHGNPNPETKQRIAPLKIIMIDEYQDFSLLFYQLVVAMRELAPTAHLFAVGDDWQAINRFAGSDVDYFINFEKYFPDDAAKIPLATNYRSCHRIVDYANRFMLARYDPKATPAIAKNREAGKIITINPARVSFDATDWQEDGLGDAKFQREIITAQGLVDTEAQYSKNLPAAKLLKSIFQIMKHFPHSEFMLLHRHNFTSMKGVDLNVLMHALRRLVVSEQVMSEQEFANQVRCMTMHKSKGLESEIVILLELDDDMVCAHHPHATIFECFGDTFATEKADQRRLLYVALTRAKRRLYLLSSDKNPPTAV